MLQTPTQFLLIVSHYLVKMKSREQLTISSNSNCVDMSVMSHDAERESSIVPVHLRSKAAAEGAETAAGVIVADQQVPLAPAHSTGRQSRSKSRFSGVDHDKIWNFHDERMQNLRLLLQLTFLTDMFTTKQAALNKKLGLVKYFPWLNDDPRSCIGFGSLIRWSLYVLLPLTRTQCNRNTRY